MLGRRPAPKWAAPPAGGLEKVRGIINNAVIFSVVHNFPPNPVICIDIFYHIIKTAGHCPAVGQKAFLIVSISRLAERAAARRHSAVQVIAAPSSRTGLP